MNANNGYEKIVPSPPASSHEKQKQWRRRALLAVICSTILLVGVIYVAIRLTPDEESGHNRIRSSDLDCKLCNSTSHYDLGISAFVREVCNSTFHYDLCVSSLSSCLGSLEANMSELARFAVEVSRDDAIRVTCFVVELKEAAEDDSRGALEDCTQLLEDTVDQLNTSVSVLAEQDWKQRIDDLTTWLSAALTNPSTCSEGFEDVGVSMNETMKQKIERVTDLVSDALAIVSFVSDLENSMENDP
jgi:pectinesterase inhibitor-like protein